MKFLITITLLAVFSVSNAADFEMSSRRFQENKNGEIVQVDGKVVDNKGNEVSLSAITRARIYNSTDKTFTSTQHILIPASTDVRIALLESSGTIKIEASVLSTEVTKRDIATFKLIKLLVREVRQ
jgi:hypothetical protein